MAELMLSDYDLQIFASNLGQEKNRLQRLGQPCADIELRWKRVKQVVAARLKLAQANGISRRKSDPSGTAKLAAIGKRWGKLKLATVEELGRGLGQQTFTEQEPPLPQPKPVLTLRQQIAAEMRNEFQVIEEIEEVSRSTAGIKYEAYLQVDGEPGKHNRMTVVIWDEEIPDFEGQGYVWRTGTVNFAVTIEDRANVWRVADVLEASWVEPKEAV